MGIVHFHGRKKVSKKRGSHTYALFQGRRKIYIGYTSDLARKDAEREREGKEPTAARKTSLLMTEAGAQQREELQLAAYRERHDGKVPRYKKTSK